jgi:hypothetical protein
MSVKPSQIYNNPHLAMQYRNHDLYLKVSLNKIYINNISRVLDKLRDTNEHTKTI